MRSWCRCCGRRSTRAVLDVGEDGTLLVRPSTARRGTGDRTATRRTRNVACRIRRARWSSPESADEMGVEQSSTSPTTTTGPDIGQRPTAGRCSAADAADQAGGATEMLRLLRRALDCGRRCPIPASPGSTCCTASAPRLSGRESKSKSLPPSMICCDRGPRLSNRCSPPSCWCGGMDLRDRRVERLDARRRRERSTSFGGAPNQRRVCAGRCRTRGRGAMGRPCRLGRHGRRRQSVSRASCESAKALAYALIAKVTARVFAGDGGGLPTLKEAQAAAAKATDFFAFVSAANWAGNCMDSSAANPDVSSTSASAGRSLPPWARRIATSPALGEGSVRLVLLGDWRAGLGTATCGTGINARAAGRHDRPG